jgi:flagellar hook-associated protein 2
MAVNSTGSAGGNSSIAQIDVASIVDQLMSIENKPLNQINKKIEKQSIVISDLGVIKSQMATFADALSSFEDADSYNATIASSSDKDVVDITSSNGATTGNYSIEVDQLATSSLYVKESFTSETQSVSVDNETGFTIVLRRENASVTFEGLNAGATIIFGGLTLTATEYMDASEVATAFANKDEDDIYENESFAKYSLDGQFDGWESGTSSGVNLTFSSTTPGNVKNLENSGSGDVSIITSFGSTKAYSTTDSEYDTLPADPTISDIVEWINSLDLNVSASLIAADEEQSSWTLMIQSTESGYANEIDSISGLKISGVSISMTEEIEAKDSLFSINGIDFERSSNSISNVIDGVTLNFFATTEIGSPVITRVRNDSSDFSNVIEAMVTSYNDLIKSYKSMTANTLTTDTPGTFASDPTTLSFISEIKTRFSNGIYYGSEYASQYSLSSLGIDMQLDGTLTFDKVAFNSAVNDGLQDILRDGIIVGYEYDSSEGTSSSLTSYLDDYLDSDGYFKDILDLQVATSWELLDRQDSIQSRLDSIKRRYITQYSALNSLLYELSMTSSALTNSLDALNNNKN